jgi:hypothetical protein
MYKKALEAFLKRKRDFSSDEDGIIYTQELIYDFISQLSIPRIADAFFQAERIYWQSKCPLAIEQKLHQDSIGLGWANHDHHTFRSSRENFSLIVKLLESLGFISRERFYAGEYAGWGAQVLENPICNIVIFADVDITQSEKDRDFSHEELESSEKIGTVGLWVGLHGESLLQAGLHHLAIRTEFDKFNSLITMMKPFSNFEFLKQAFSEAQKWNVDKNRLNNMYQKNVISEEQHQMFKNNGAIASHLESIQRDQGFKGFNQDSVTAIIKAVDPRKQIKPA